MAGLGDLGAQALAGDPLQQAGLLRVLARLSPVLTYKTSGGAC